MNPSVAAAESSAGGVTTNSQSTNTHSTKDSGPSSYTLTMDEASTQTMEEAGNVSLGRRDEAWYRQMEEALALAMMTEAEMAFRLSQAEARNHKLEKEFDQVKAQLSRLTEKENALAAGRGADVTAAEPESNTAGSALSYLQNQQGESEGPSQQAQNSQAAQAADTTLTKTNIKFGDWVAVQGPHGKTTDKGKGEEKEDKEESDQDTPSESDGEAQDVDAREAQPVTLPSPDTLTPRVGPIPPGQDCNADCKELCQQTILSTGRFCDQQESYLKYLVATASWKQGEAMRQQTRQMEKTVASLESQMVDRMDSAIEALESRLLGHMEGVFACIERKLHGRVDEAIDCVKSRMVRYVDRMLEYFETRLFSRVDGAIDALETRLVGRMDGVLGSHETQLFTRVDGAIDSLETRVGGQVNRALASHETQLSANVEVAVDAFETSLIDRVDTALHSVQRELIVRFEQRIREVHIDMGRLAEAIGGWGETYEEVVRDVTSQLDIDIRERWQLPRRSSAEAPREAQHQYQDEAEAEAEAEAESEDEFDDESEDNSEDDSEDISEDDSEDKPEPGPENESEDDSEIKPEDESEDDSEIKPEDNSEDDSEDKPEDESEHKPEDESEHKGFEGD